MASRYPTYKVVDYCFHPIRVCDGDKDIIVPCGKCDGCLLHKANDWSMRCGMEIEGSPATIFGSLTYSNKYYPKLYPFFRRNDDRFVPYEDFKNFSQTPVGFSLRLGRDLDFVWSSNHNENIRFNGSYDVLREDNIDIYPINSGNFEPVQISHWDNFYRPSIGYCSKRDIQLWLKLLRRFLDYGISYKSKRVLESGYFRYFIISEIGPTTFRGHAHFLIFCQSSEIASALLEGALYKNWKMCDEDKFEPYVHLCDSGARGYVTQYLTSFSSLPRVYREAKEIRPFRLASKSPGIGYIEQDKEEIFESINRRTIKYIRAVARLDSKVILSYPKSFCTSVFPKCYRYSKIPDSRRFSIYSYLYREVKCLGREYSVVSSRLREELHASDYLATRACYKFCCLTGESPDYYYYLHDMYYYLVEMDNLRNFYLSQQDIDFLRFPDRIFEFYSNIEVICLDSGILKSRPYMRVALDFCLYPLGFDYRVLLGNKEFFEFVHLSLRDRNDSYYREVSDICDNMVKMPKYNEMTLNAPTIV